MNVDLYIWNLSVLFICYAVLHYLIQYMKTLLSKLVPIEVSILDMQESIQTLWMEVLVGLADLSISK